MTSGDTQQRQRQRAPSARSLETRGRILDAAERVFAERGFDGASMRDIAEGAGVRVGLVHHHSGGKEDLFRLAVARRADTLAALRIETLAARKTQGPMDLRGVLECFFGPYVALAQSGEAQWLAYARLVAHVSADPRWRDIAAECFDPTAQEFIAEITRLLPGATPERVAGGFVYSVAAMLAHLTSIWRMQALGGGGSVDLAGLVDFCAAGLAAVAGDPPVSDR